MTGKGENQDQGGAVKKPWDGQGQPGSARSQRKDMPRAKFPRLNFWVQ